MAQMKDLQVREGDQKEDTSSREKRIPPMGALKAAATPAAAGWRRRVSEGGMRGN
jgi:hypothetical protein